LQAAYLALIGNIVSAALESASLRAQIAAREELLEGQEERLELIRIRVEEGAEARADLVTALAEIATLRAAIPQLRADLAASDNRLALLVGDAPAEAAIPALALDEMRLPRAVPISLPSRLVRARPDILAAEAVLARTSAEIGVETADLYPSVTLMRGSDSAAGRAAWASARRRASSTWAAACSRL
jgi:outer membrane protein TolC